MNEVDIERAIALAENVPQYRPYIQYLDDWRRVINANSDGWSYWHIGRRCADRLMKLTGELIEWIRYGGDHPHRLPQPPKPTLKDFRASLRSIRSFATRHKLEAPILKE